MEELRSSLPKMKYDQATTELITTQYALGVDVAAIAKMVAETCPGVSVPPRSVIAKLSSLGVYKKKVYTTKRGEVPVPKAELIEKLASLLEMDIELLESLEKVNKAILVALINKLSDPKPPKTDL